MARKHIMTAKRRAALRKAQLASARARKRVLTPKNKKRLKRAGAAALVRISRNMGY